MSHPDLIRFITIHLTAAVKVCGVSWLSLFTILFCMKNLDLNPAHGFRLKAKKVQAGWISYSPGASAIRGPTSVEGIVSPPEQKALGLVGPAAGTVEP